MTINEMIEAIDEANKKAQTEIVDLMLTIRTIQVIIKMIKDATPDPSESGGERKEDYTTTPTETGTGCLKTTPTPAGEDEGREAAASL